MSGKFHKTFGSKDAEGFSHRRPTHPEFASNLLDHELLARMNAPLMNGGQNRVANPVGLGLNSRPPEIWQDS